MAHSSIAGPAKERMVRIELIDSANQEQQSLYIPDIYDILIGKMLLDVSEIEGLQQQGPAPTSFEVLISSIGVWTLKGIDRFIGKKFSLSNGRNVVIDRPYEQLTHVIIKRVPMCWNRDTLNRIFNWYGTVKRVSRDVWRNRDETEQQFNGTWNGSYRIVMKVSRAIPSSISVEGQRIEVHYRDQGISCWRCGLSHLKKDCKTHYKEYVNRFRSLNEFDTQPDEPSESVESATNEPEPRNPEAVETVLNTHNEQEPENRAMDQESSEPNVAVETESSNFVTGHIAESTDDMLMDAVRTAEETLQSQLKADEEFNRREKDIENALQESSVEIIESILEGADEQELVVDFHHRDCSQIVVESVESEDTITASEAEDQITPGQRSPLPQDDGQSSLLQEESDSGEDHHISSFPDQSQHSAESQGIWSLVTGRGKSKRAQSSTDDESETIGLIVGSFVNSMLSRTGKENKKSKQ